MSHQKKNFILVSIGLILTLLVGCLNISQQPENLAASNPSNALSLEIPIDCNLGEDCFIMHYVDLDPAEAAVDFNCGRQTYDGHKGTDFGIADLEVMAKGVPVLAATSGTVLRIRDGIPDRLVDSAIAKQVVENTECGNGVVIDSGNGWETQYCHLRQGSVAVKPNTRVERGTVLGMVGASGLASFPHVHLSVRRDNIVIDPFTGTDMTKGCNQSRKSLWSKSLKYVPTGLINAGFTDRSPTQPELWSGMHNNKQLPSNSPALIFWVHAYGVLRGDVEKWQLIAPDGSVEIEQETTLEKPFRSWMSFTGKRNFTSGKWKGEYQLWRGKSQIFNVKREVIVNMR